MQSKNCRNRTPSEDNVQPTNSTANISNEAIDLPNASISETISELPPKPPDPPPYDPDNMSLNFKWGSFDGDAITRKVNHTYEQIVYWKKNIFLLPKGAAGKHYICEITRLVNAWVENSPLKSLALKAIMIMPALLLQKPTKKSKSKDHKMALERRLKQWEEGLILELLKEGKTIQDRLKFPKQIAKSTKAISQKFIERMSKGNINGAIKLLSDNMVDGIVPLNDDTLEILRQKHPDQTQAEDEVLLPDEPIEIHPVIFDEIDADAIRQAAVRTKGGSGPSGMDGDGWRRLLTSKQYGQESTDLCKAIARFGRTLCINTHSEETLQPLLAY